MKLHSNQIVLRDWREADFEVDRLWYEGKHKWMDFNGPYYPLPQKVEQEKWREKMRQKINTAGFEHPRQNLVIAEKESDFLLGTVNRYWQSIETHWLSIGIVIYNDRYWGKGIGEEALKLWGSYLFEQMPQIARLDMRTWSGNHGLMHLAEKLGFRKEAVFRKARIVDGCYFDSIAYGILREEWQELHGIENVNQE